MDVVFACYQAACRPPRAGGTGGSSGGGKKTIRVKRPSGKITKGTAQMWKDLANL